MFASDRTCCICRQPGLVVQIHHLDEDPGSHRIDNLAVLCLQHHNLTQVRGGFGRGLPAAEVRAYRDAWLSDVQLRRARANELAAQAMARSSVAPPTDPRGRFVMPPAAFVATLPWIRKEALAQARHRWSGNTTAEVINFQGEYIESLRSVLLALAAFFPANHFDDKPAQEYFSEAISARARWHRARMEPDGPGTRGTMIGPLVAAAVASDVEQMIVEIVGTLSFDPDRKPDFGTWKTSWDAASSEA
jgi:hypothetical protein